MDVKVTKRHFIRVRTADGFVDQDLEVERQDGDWSTLNLQPPPTHTMVEMTDDPVFEFGKLPGTIMREGKFEKPVRRVLKKLEFVRRFAVEEQVAIEGGSKISTPQLQAYWNRLLLAEDVNLDHPEVVGALDLLVKAGLLTAARAAEIRA